MRRWEIVDLICRLLRATHPTTSLVHGARSQQYGFQNQDELIRVALGKLQQELDSLEMSADLCAEVYAEDADLQDLTDSAIAGWPG